MIKIHDMSILNATEDIIVHQVNCRGVMGAGLAKAIADRYLTVRSLYEEVCALNNPDQMMGVSQFINVSDGKTIVNAFAQDKFGRDKKYTDYDALKSCLETVVDYAIEYNKTIALPYGIGCGLAGGDWNIVLRTIKHVYEGSGLDIVLYRV